MVLKKFKSILIKQDVLKFRVIVTKVKETCLQYLHYFQPFGKGNIFISAHTLNFCTAPDACGWVH